MWHRRGAVAFVATGLVTSFLSSVARILPWSRHIVKSSIGYADGRRIERSGERPVWNGLVAGVGEVDVFRTALGASKEI